MRSGGVIATRCVANSARSDSSSMCCLVLRLALLVCVLTAELAVNRMSICTQRLHVCWCFDGVLLRRAGGVGRWVCGGGALSLCVDVPPRVCVFPQQVGGASHCVPRVWGAAVVGKKGIAHMLVLRSGLSA